MLASALQHGFYNYNNGSISLSVLPRDGAPRLSRESQLRVSHDTELYRILNMHYNKSNVYQVRRVSIVLGWMLLYLIALQWSESMRTLSLISSTFL